MYKLIDLKNYEYRLCFEKDDSLTNGGGKFSTFDWYELYPMVSMITPLDTKIKQRIECFKEECKDELNERSRIKFNVSEHDDYFILECHFNGNIHKRIKLLKNNKVDFTYEDAVYAGGKKHNEYIENLYERHMECMEALSGVSLQATM